MTESQLFDLEKSLEMSAAMHGLQNLDKPYILFYDETNNVRKLHIREDNKLNVPELADFVLGGIVCTKGIADFDFTKLRSELKLDKDIKEIKLKHLAKGDFLELLPSKKLNLFLRWILNQNLLVHHSHLDPFYWSVVDIVDSILLHVSELQAYHQNLKSDLTELCKQDLPTFVSILSKHNYPDVIPKNTRAFCEDLLEHISRQEASVAHFNFQMIKGLLEMAREQRSLDFIEGYNPKKLIESFEVFYITRMLMFKNSQHIFDNEPHIAESFAASHLIAEKFKNIFKFVQSEDHHGIQISDVLMGLLGKMYTYVRDANLKDVSTLKDGLEPIAIENLKILEQIFSTSECENKAFLHHVASLYDLNKLKILFTF